MSQQRRERMVTQEEARYRPATMPGRRCENCALFMDGGHCTKVKGDIQWDHTCDEFTWNVYKY